MIKIGIVDDHAIVRSGLRQFFLEHVDLRVVGEAASGREAIDLVRGIAKSAVLGRPRRLLTFKYRHVSRPLGAAAG